MANIQMLITLLLFFSLDDRVVLKSETSMKVLVPWSNDTVIVGIDGEATFSLPAEFFVALDRRSPQKIVQYGIKPQNLPVSVSF